MKINVAALLLFSMVSFATVQAQVKKKTSAPASHVSQASIDRGKQVYAAQCLTCHQADGSGVPGMNPPLIKTKWVLGDKSKLIEVVVKGLKGVAINDENYHNVMPPHTNMTDDEIADVLTFIRNSFGNKASSVTPAQVKAVRAKLLGRTDDR